MPPPAPHRGGLFFRPLRPSSVGGHVPILPSSFPPLVRRPTANRRHFCARGQQGGAGPKKQDRRKGHLQARRAVFVPGSIPTLPHTKSPYKGPQSAQQDIKQPRPTPLGASRGIIICSGPERAPRSALCQRPTKSRSRPCTVWPPLLQTPSLWTRPQPPRGPDPSADIVA